MIIAGSIKCFIGNLNTIQWHDAASPWREEIQFKAMVETDGRYKYQ